MLFLNGPHPWTTATEACDIGSFRCVLLKGVSQDEIYVNLNTNGRLVLDITNEMNQLVCLLEKICVAKEESRAKICMDLNANGKPVGITNEIKELVWHVYKGFYRNLNTICAVCLWVFRKDTCLYVYNCEV
jgi:hypothetical protein